MPSTREAALALCATLTPALEGCRLNSYADTGGVWTIGYGHTHGVQPGETISQDTANYLLRGDESDAADAVERCVSRSQLDTLLDNHQRAALYDFAFNLGADPKWQIWKLLRAGNVNGARDQIPRFDRGLEGGKLVVVPGLEHRRTAEVIFWNTADVAAAVAVTQTPNTVSAPSSGYTRSIPTPPAPEPAPVGDKTALVAKVGTVVAAAGAAATQAHSVISPYSDASPIFQHLDVIFISVIVGAGLVALAVHEFQAHARKT